MTRTWTRAAAVGEMEMKRQNNTENCLEDKRLKMWRWIGCGQWRVRKNRTMDDAHTFSLGAWMNHGGYSKNRDYNMKGNRDGDNRVVSIHKVKFEVLVRHSKTLLCVEKFSSSRTFLTKTWSSPPSLFLLCFVGIWVSVVVLVHRLNLQLLCSRGGKGESSAESLLPSGLALQSVSVAWPSEVMSRCHAMIW